MIKEYLESESKQSLMRLITYMMTWVTVIIAIGQLAVQIITAIKGDSVFQPNWYGIAAMFLMTVLGKTGQKYIENKK